MTARIELAHVLADLIGSEGTETVDGATVGAALRGLTARHPPLDALVWREGRFNDQLVLFLNRQDVRRLDGMDTPLADGDELMLITAVEGG